MYLDQFWVDLMLAASYIWQVVQLFQYQGTAFCIASIYDLVCLVNWVRTHPRSSPVVRWMTVWQSLKQLGGCAWRTHAKQNSPIWKSLPKHGWRQLGSLGISFDSLFPRKEKLFKSSVEISRKKSLSFFLQGEDVINNKKLVGAPALLLLCPGDTS